MRALATFAAAALTILAVSPPASAEYNGRDCSTGYAVGNDNAGAHAGSGGMPGTTSAAGACVNVPNLTGLEGGAVEAGIGDDPPAHSAADPAVVPGFGLDAYAIVDGDDGNTLHPASTIYAGLSNWETGGSRATGCGTGYDSGDPGSSNSGGCMNNVGVPPFGPLPAGSLPTPVCGTSYDNDWSDSNRDGCEVVD